MTDDDQRLTIPVRPRRVGRLSTLTPEVQDRFLTELRKGISVKYAARLAGLNVGVVEKWIQRGRGTLPDRAATPEYVAFVEAIDDARAHTVGQLADYVLAGAKTDPHLALRLLDRFDPDWMPRSDQAIVEDNRAFLRPGVGSALADESIDMGDEPLRLTERVRELTVPAARIHEFTRSLRGKGKHDDGDRLSRFRETEGELPPT